MSGIDHGETPDEEHLGMNDADEVSRAQSEGVYHLHDPGDKPRVHVGCDDDHSGEGANSSASRHMHL